MDLTTQKFNPKDPVSVEIAVAQAERSIDYHLQAFAHNAALPAIRKDIIAKCYSSDISRKRNSSTSKNKAKRMKRIDRADIPQEVFLAVLKFVSSIQSI